jgi:hypothetical protein
MELHMRQTSEEKHEGEKSLRDEFHLEEYKALRAEILLLKQFQSAIQKWIIASLGIVYGLAFSLTVDKGINLLPKIDRLLLTLAGFAISAFGASYYSITDYTINNISKYLQKIEARLIKGKEPEPEGWEHFQGVGTGKRPIWGVRRNPYWWCVLAFSTLLVVREAFFGK